MSSHAKLSTSHRVLTVFGLLILLSFAFAMLPSPSDAKRPTKEAAGSTTVYDTTVPPLDKFVSVDVEPAMYYLEVPARPRKLRGKQAAGDVWIRAGVDMRGVVRDVKVARSSASQALDDAAIAAAWKCKFKPAIKNGMPVAAWVVYLVSFTGEPDSEGQERAIAAQVKGEPDTSLPGPTDSVAVDTVAEMIYNAQPNYPDIAKVAGLTGSVWIRCLVDKTGNVRAVVVQKSSGSLAIDESAAKSAWNNRFNPAKKDNQAVATWTTFRVDFKMSDK